LNSQPQSIQTPPSKDIEGFEKVSIRRRPQKNPIPPRSNINIKMIDSYEILSKNKEGHDDSPLKETWPKVDPNNEYNPYDNTKHHKTMDLNSLDLAIEEEEMQEDSREQIDFEDGEEIDVGELYLQYIVVACEWQDLNSIQEKQVQIDFWKIPLSASRYTVNHPPKVCTLMFPHLVLKLILHMRTPKPLGRKKKRGLRRNKQLLQELGELLVNSGHIALMNTKFPPIAPHFSWILSLGIFVD
jgi:hypothetical protein